MDSSAYLVADQDKNVQRLRTIKHNISEDWWDDEQLTALSFQKVRLATASASFALVPARLYDADQRATYLNIEGATEGHQVVLADGLADLNAYLVYRLPAETLNLWRRTFVGCRFYHLLSPVLAQLHQQNRLRGRASIYAFFQQSQVAVIGMERGQLTFCNSFKFNSAKDALYYILLAFEQSGWSPDYIPLAVFGDILQDSEIHRLLFRYIRHIQWQQDIAELRWGTAAQAHPKHLFYALNCLHLYH